jgi:4-amino-4-deoxy-L-arabinose transferase-like glycosyltransferase
MTVSKEKAASLRHSGYVPSSLISLVVVVSVGLYYFPAISHGYLQHYDEFYTLSRTLSFIEHSDWLSIWFNGDPVFKKPPLQYWLGALLIAAGAEPLVALRAWPLIFGLCLLAATGLLAHACSQNRPYVIPTAIILLTSSALVWTHAISAMLETGTAFFLVLTIASMILAARSPGWWIVTGLSAGLAFLQKSPAPVVLAGCFIAWLYLHACFGQREEKSLYRSSIQSLQFKIGTVLAFILVSFWPLVQIWRHGWRYLHVAFGREILQRFAPSMKDTSGAPSFSFAWTEWMFDDAFWFWAAALVALVSIPLMAELRRELGAKTLLATLALFFFVFTLAGGKIYPRYLIQVAPLMAAALAIAAAQVVKPPALLPILALAFVLATGKVFHDTTFLLSDRNASLIEEVVHFSRSVDDGEHAIFFTWNANGRLAPGLIVHYAGLDRPVELIGSRRTLQRRYAQGLFKRPHRAFSKRSSLAAVEKELGGISVVEERGDYVSWRASPAAREDDSEDCRSACRP